MDLFKWQINVGFVHLYVYSRKQVHIISEMVSLFKESSLVPEAGIFYSGGFLARTQVGKLGGKVLEEGGGAQHRFCYIPAGKLQTAAPRGQPSEETKPKIAQRLTLHGGQKHDFSSSVESDVPGALSTAMKKSKQPRGFALILCTRQRQMFGCSLN